MMTLRRAVVPAFLALCLTLGGASAAGLIANLFLQLAALGLLVWALLARTQVPPPRAARAIVALAAAVAIVFLLELVPLPPAIWQVLPGRAEITDGYRLLGIGLPWLPLSLSSAGTVASGLWWLPAWAVLVAMVRLNAFSPRILAWTVVAMASVNVLLGAAQIIGGVNSPLFFYEITNNGRAVGLFANSNHTADLLVVAIPFLAALQFKGLGQARSQGQAAALMVLTSAAFIVLVIGLIINASLAGLGLAVPAALASFLLLRRDTSNGFDWRLLVTALAGAAAVAAIFIGPFDNNLTGPETTGRLQQQSRKVSIGNTLAAGVDYLPFGSGSGTFRQIYRSREVPSEVDSTYMNHAHSDLAEVFLEDGVVGMLLVALLLLWWGSRVVALWRSPEPDLFARAASIAAGVMMAHSLVDYPLRTAGLSALFAACLGLMSEVRPAVQAQIGRGRRRRSRRGRRARD